MGIIPQKLINKGKYWTKALSLVGGCLPISESCDNCWCAQAAHIRQYQKNPKIRKQYGGLTYTRYVAPHKRGVPKFNGTIHIHEDRLKIPFKTRKSQVFSIWSDICYEAVPFEFIDKAVTVMTGAVGHIFLALTKRPKRLVEYFEKWQPFDPNKYVPNNIYWGTTCETQKCAEERIPELLKIPGKKFLSIEPILEDIDILPYLCSHKGWLHDGTMCPRSFYSDPCSNFEKCSYRQISQVVVGGETGRYARPCHPDWIRSLRDQCAKTKVSFFFKSWGTAEGWKKPPHNLRDTKKDRLLDGSKHDDLIWNI